MIETTVQDIENQESLLWREFSYQNEEVFWQNYATLLTKAQNKQQENTPPLLLETPHFINGDTITENIQAPPQIQPSTPKKTNIWVGYLAIWGAVVLLSLILSWWND